MPYIGNQPGTGVRSRFIYTATASQTTFSGADDNGKTLKYADSDYIDVYLNGVCLVPGTDYTASTKTSVVLTQAASVSDTLEVVAYDVASMADTVSKADGGTFEDGITIRTADNTAQLTLESTDDDAGIGPHQVYYRNSSSPADNDLLAEIDHRGRNDNSQDVDYATVNIFAEDVSDGTEDGKYLLQTMKAGAAVSRMDVNSTETVFNDDSKDLDFRVESDDNANMIHVDGANDIVGIGRVPDPNDGGAGSLQIEGNDGLAMRRNGQTNSFILRPIGTGDGMRFTQGGTGDRMTIDSSGHVNINAASASGGYSGYNLMVRGSSPAVKFESTVSNNTWDLYGAGGSHFYFGYNGVDKGNINTSTGNYTATSDVNKKKDFENSDIGLEEVLQLQPKLFRMIDDESDAPKHLGFIAQDVQPIIPQSYVEETNDDRTFIGLQDRPIIAALTKAVQELSAKVDALEAQNTTQATQIADLITRVTALEAG